jgi:hypothetical protein
LRNEVAGDRAPVPIPGRAGRTGGVPNVKVRLPFEDPQIRPWEISVELVIIRIREGEG